jgi:A/G-specific adenine glycosylase
MRASLPWRTGPAEIAKGAKPDPVSRLAVGDHAAADHRRRGEGLFREVHGEMAGRRGARRRERGRHPEGLGRARLLFARPQPEEMRRRGDDRAWRAFPETSAGLRALPGIGDYTSAAIAAIAFDEPVAVVDGNVERVVSRLYAIDTPLPSAKKEIRALTQALTPAGRPGDFAQAMMDLGATLCTPKRPACLHCPLREDCAALSTGDPERFPVKPPKKAKPVRRGAAYVLTNRDGAILLEKRGDTGLLAGMAQVPTTAWTAREDGATDTSEAPLPAADWIACGAIGHVFTHFELRLDVFRAAGEITPAARQWWSAPEDIAGEALPTVMKKVLFLAIEHESQHDLD